MPSSFSACALAQLQNDVVRQKSQRALKQNTTNKKLKIAVVAEAWSSEFNAQAWSILQLVKRLQCRGHQFLLVRPQQELSVDTFMPEQECLVKADSISKINPLHFSWGQSIKVGRAFDQFKPDIVHVVTEGPLGLLALNQAKQRGIPVSSGFDSSFHHASRYFDLAFLMRPIRHYLRWFHNQTDLTCVPNQLALSVLTHLRVHCPIQIIGKGVDNQKFHPQYRDYALRQKWQANRDTTVLLHIECADSEKDYLSIFAAYQKLKLAQPHRDFRLVIIGDGPTFAAYKAQHSDVIFMGSPIGELLSHCYASADICVSVNQVKAVGRTVLEAMASGLPVLTYDSVAESQMIENKKQGWVVPAGELAQWCKMLIQIPELLELKAMGKHATIKAERYGWDQPVVDFEQALIHYSKKMVYQKM